MRTISTEYSEPVPSESFTLPLPVVLDVTQPDTSTLMLLLYPIGIPVFFRQVLRNRPTAITSRDPRAPISQLNDTIAPYAFLFFAYKAGDKMSYLAEVYDSVRRIMLCGLVVFMGRTSVQRCMGGFLCSLIYLFVSREYMPYV
jgi:hypothetical protein